MNVKLISLSGIDGAGKSTQITSIKNYYKKNQHFTYLWTRGGNTPGIEMLKLISRKIVGKKLPPSGHSAQRDQIFKKKWVQKVWLTFAIIDLFRIYAISTRWDLWRGIVVICDRYLWDTLIDFKIMFPGVDIEKWILWKFLVWGTPIPSVEYLLIIPSELSEKRCLQKYEPFPDTEERRERRFKLYKELSNLNKWVVIDATQNAETVFAKIKSQLP
jgi:dTMP kinase